VLALILVAASVGVSNLAASIGIGAGGVTMATRIRVLLTFGLFEGAMPIIGLLIGDNLATDIGHQARLVGALLLGGVGAYGIGRFVLPRIRGGGDREPAKESEAESEAEPGPGPDSDSRHRLSQWIKIGVSAFALSLDNLIAGFALGSYQMSLVEGALVFGIVSVTMSLAGLEIGAKLGNWAGDSGELIGGVVLVGVGVAIGTGVLG
jgi:manganese efflux pump family protein